MTETTKLQGHVDRYSFSDKYKTIIEMFRKLVAEDEIAIITGVQNDMKDFVLSVFSSRAYTSGFLYLCSRGAVTALVMQEELALPEATAYRVLSRLRKIGIVKVALKIPTASIARGGPRPQVFFLQGATNEEIAEAARQHEVLADSIDLNTLGRARTRRSEP